MADFKGDIAALIAEHVEGLSREEIRGMIEIPQNKEMGDYAFL